MKRATLLLILTALLLFQPYAVQAQSTPSCSFQPDGSIICTVGGGNDDGGGGGEGGGGGACTPGEHMVYQVANYDAASGTCTAFPLWVDNCTGQVIDSAGDAVTDMPCELPSTPPDHPCTTFTVSAGGITCGNTDWKVSARVTFPEIYLDVRPFPATLVRWRTAVRNGGLPSSSGSGTQDYYGTGSFNNPDAGDWSNIRLTLTLKPASPMFVTLPHIGTLSLFDQGASGTPRIIQWEVPSHPEAGGAPLARTVPGMEELPGDMPLFVGSGRSAYRLFWNLSYAVYEAVEDCVAGPNGNGVYNCGGGTGHKVVVGYDWQRHSSGGEISPSDVQNLPARIAADLNGDGNPDAYWDYNLTLRRMDDNNRVDNPRYRRSWNWGGIIYWAVREGQGQIGWPGGE